MVVKIKKLIPAAVIPSYAKPGDAGMDLTATGLELTGAYYEYKTGLAFEIPDGYVGLLFPRSSCSNTGFVMANAVGVIDSKFRGEVTVRFKYVDTSCGRYNVGDRVAQLIILPYPQINFLETSELSDTERGTGGYGSSGS